MASCSVIIINYNTLELTSNCINALYKSNKSINDLEIIVVDNGSTEISSLELQQLYPNIKYIKNTKNIGFAKGNNSGIKQATKDYVVLLNSDVIIEKEDTLFRCMIEIMKYPDPVILSPALITESGEYQCVYGRLPSLGNEILLSMFLYKLLPQKCKYHLLVDFEKDKKRIISKGWLVATCLIFKREIVTSLPEGKLPEITFLYGEELFWGNLWSKRHIKQIYNPGEKVMHLIGKSSDSSSEDYYKKRRAFQVYSEYLFVRSHNPNIVTYSFYLVRLIRYLIISLYNSEIIILRNMTIDILTSRFVKKYPFVTG